MVTMNYSGGNNVRYRSNYTFYMLEEEASPVMKSKEVGYTSILNLLRITDRSKNNFSGVLPAELVTDLVALRSLNLFHNHFKEKFPGSIHWCYGKQARIFFFPLLKHRFYVLFSLKWVWCSVSCSRVLNLIIPVRWFVRL